MYKRQNFTTSGNSFYEEIYQARFISDHFDQFAGLSDKLVQMLSLIHICHSEL